MYQNTVRILKNRNFEFEKYIPFLQPLLLCLLQDKDQSRSDHLKVIRQQHPSKIITLNSRRVKN